MNDKPLKPGPIPYVVGIGKDKIFEIAVKYGFKPNFDTLLFANALMCAFEVHNRMTEPMTDQDLMESENSSTIPSLNDMVSANSQEIRPKWLKPNEVFGWRGYFDVRGFERMYGDVFDSEEECVARTPTATGYQKVVIELPENEMVDDDE